MDRLSQQARRSGILATPVWQVPEDAQGKIQIHLDIEATDRRDETQAIECIVDISKDGLTGWGELARFTWNGQEKSTRRGWPSTGPAIRVDVDQEKGSLRGMFFRCMVMAPRGISYAVDIGIITPKELSDARVVRGG